MIIYDRPSPWIEGELLKPYVAELAFCSQFFDDRSYESPAACGQFQSRFAQIFLGSLKIEKSLAIREQSGQ